MTLRNLKLVFPDQAETLQGLIDGKIDPESFDSVADWIRQCYHPPTNTDELILKAINEVLDGFGIEAIRDPKNHIDNYHFDIVASYVNMGDTYANTIILDHDRDRYYVTTLGDWIEAYEKRKGYQLP